jgi:molecular chaperone HtpG
MSANLARILRAAGQKVPETKPILRSARHPIVLRLRGEQARFADWAALLHEQALLAGAGGRPDS